ncbi:hypothetical protein [Nocardioides sp.]|uniref:hypothetical protein n=1 Tax=Nocardioides sp. TaxID=35761 RepID=UPI002CEBFFE5|nr:hypothetical protein [Nocardioides sp.]HXH77846.1 hypothetical protein [Nocardioides sp.]
MATTPRRTLAAVIAALALTVPVAMSASATGTSDDNHGSAKAPKAPKPSKAPKAPKSSKPSKPSKASEAPKTKQLLKAIDVRDAKLERLTTAERTSELSDDVEAAFVANMTADRTALATLRADAEAVGSTLDVKTVRKDLHDFRVVNYVLAGNILRKAEKLETELTADPTAAAQLAAAVDAALAITAVSTKDDVRDARDLLKLAKPEDEDEAPAPVG